MKTKTRGLIVFVGLALIGAGVYGWYHGRKTKLIYQTVPVTKGDVRQVILSTGTVAPENRIDLKPPVAGRVERVLVQEGDHVRAGQVLAWMSSAERATLIDTAKSKGKEELAYWEDAYKESPILAPRPGLIILKSADAGQSVATTDIVLSMSDRLIVKANVDETDLSQIKVGQKATTVLDAFAKQSFDSKVIHIGYDAKTVNNVTTYEVDVMADQIPEFMKSGMTANITFLIDQKLDTLVVPAAAIHREKHKSYVLQPNPQGGDPIKTEIEVGLSDGKKVEVLSGLKEGDTLLAAELQVGAPRGPRSSSPFGMAH